MLTKQDFQRAIKDSIAAYPAVAPLYQAGDPRIHQNLDAMATMLAMVSAQMEVAMTEPFAKARDATVLADAAMRGLVPKGTPARVRVLVTNKGAEPFQVEIGRTLLDSAGRSYRIETAARVPAGGQAAVEASQVYAQTVRHKVFGSVPFYAVPIPEADDGSHLCGVAVSDSIGAYEHRERYVNSWPDERIFHVEADDQQRVYVRFGFDGVVGVQPPDGQELTLTVFRTSGAIEVAAGAPFSFEYIRSPLETGLELQLDAMLVAGQNPMSMATLRDLARYPSVYDHSAVFLGEFDFLVRRAFPTLRFLSVWNEAAEEAARGPSLDNMNTLFVACLSAVGDERVLSDEAQGSARTAPELIAEGELTETQHRIRNAILMADDSYRVRFYTPVRSKVYMAIHATVSTSYVASDVRAAIVQAILDEFGESAETSRRGSAKPLYQRIYALIKERVPALSDGQADLKVNITETQGPVRPELWRFVAPDSLSVAVVTANITTPSWGG